MAKPTRISLAAARRLAVAAQGLDGAWEAPPGKAGAAAVVERLGYVQIDTISVVQRAHHHVLWSRCGDYHPDMLHELQAVDRRVFEYWTHAASYVPMRDYRWYLPRMRAHAANPRSIWFREKNSKVIRHVLDRIRGEGPLRAADFEDTGGRKRGPWWDWKPAKTALETLFTMGELMVTERRGFQRVYDLAERVLPADVDTIVPTPAEDKRFRIRKTIQALGVTDMSHGSMRDPDEALAELTEAGEVTEVKIAGLDGGPFHAATAALAAGRRRSRRVHILSPFDNLVIRRGTLRRLFDFDYKLECYTPAARRRYGYFCLPVLAGGDFIARIDTKAERKSRTLTVRQIIFEPGFDAQSTVLRPLAAKLIDFAAFNDCPRVVIEKTSPVKLRAELRRSMREVE